MNAARYRVRVTWRDGLVTYVRPLATRAEAEIVALRMLMVRSVTAASVEPCGVIVFKEAA